MLQPFSKQVSAIQLDGKHSEKQLIKKTFLNEMFSHFYKLSCVLDFVIYKIYCKKKKHTHTPCIECCIVAYIGTFAQHTLPHL